MQACIKFAIDTLDVDKWETVETDDVLKCIYDRFDGKLPSNTRIYHETVSEETNVTPIDETGIVALSELEGTVYVVVIAGDPITLIAIAVGAIVAAAAFLLVPKPPTPTLRNTQAESPNNALSARSNQARIAGRIPDIVGTVRSTPDLLSVPYTIFIDNTEVEYSYLCIGRGEYYVDPNEVKDGDTRALLIGGTSVEIFGPNTSPMSGGIAQLRIGDAIAEPLYIVHKSNAVVGQTLEAPNSKNVVGRTDIAATPTGFVTSDGSSHIFNREFQVGDVCTVEGCEHSDDVVMPAATTNISVRFDNSGTMQAQTAADVSGISVGDVVTLGNAVFVEEYEEDETDFGGDEFTYIVTADLNGPYVVTGVSGGTLTFTIPSNKASQWSRLSSMYGGGTTYYKTCSVTGGASTGGTTVNLDGNYTISAITGSTITFNDPSAIEEQWLDVPLFGGGITLPLSPRIYTNTTNWIGPFTIEHEVNAIAINFVANQGIYKDDGEAQIAASVQCQVEVTPIDENGVATGSASTYFTTLTGSKDTKTRVARTLNIPLPVATRVRIRAYRTTPADLNFEGSVVDEVKIRDVYGLQLPVETHFGNITTVHAKTIGTENALGVKDRKLNLEVTRKFPRRVSGTTFSQPEPTTYAPDIFVALSVDPYIGGLSLDDLDLDDIYDTGLDIQSHFGTPNAAAFSYTFDKDNLTYEETAGIIANTVFSTAYRRGTKISLFFEKPVETSSLLLNHRNKVPGSETRTVMFGSQDKFDGVEFSYVDPADDAIITIYIPEDKSATNPQKTESIGVRNHLQAYFHAWRNFNKIMNQNLSVSFEATSEIDLLVVKERFLNADNTRTGTQDGEVKAQDGLVLTLSQPIEFDSAKTYSIFLQHTDYTVENIQVTEGARPTQVVLANAPRLALSIDPESYARTTYQVVGSGEQNAQAFLLVEKRPLEGLTTDVSGVNYSDEYYANDQKFADDEIDEDATPLP